MINGMFLAIDPYCFRALLIDSFSIALPFSSDSSLSSEQQQKRQQVKEAIESGKPLPADLREEACFFSQL